MGRYDGTFTVGPRYKGELQMKYLYIGNDNIVKIDRLKEDVFGGTYLNNATATAVLFDINGTTVSGVTFPITIAYVTDSPGIYEGTLNAEDLSLTEGNEYDLDVTVTANGDQVAKWSRRFVAVKRRQ